MSQSPGARRSSLQTIIRLHRWLGLGAALFWLLQAVTGVLLSFHFELEDVVTGSAHRATDLAAIEQRLDTLAAAGGDAHVNWVWTSAGLPDRYVISFADAQGTARRARIDGSGAVLHDAPVTEPGFLGFMLLLHTSLAAGTVGQWILVVSGTLLVTNLVFGLVTAWPPKGRSGRMWRSALRPARTANPRARLYSWHRAIGLWAVVPAIFIAGTGTLILLEHELREAFGVPDVSLPANAPDGPAVGFAAASRAAVQAIPGSRFVGTTLPSAEDASYYAWVRAPGELYRGGYGRSLVIVDANDASIRGAWPATEARGADAVIGAFYPLHTGEAGGTIGRMLGMAIGVWLAVTVVLGVWLWLRRPPRGAGRSAQTARPPINP